MSESTRLAAGDTRPEIPLSLTEFFDDTRRQWVLNCDGAPVIDEMGLTDQDCWLLCRLIEVLIVHTEEDRYKDLVTTIQGKAAEQFKLEDARLKLFARVHEPLLSDTPDPELQTLVEGDRDASALLAEIKRRLDAAKAQSPNGMRAVLCLMEDEEADMLTIALLRRMKKLQG